jgi:hypothetical protein
MAAGAPVTGAVQHDEAEVMASLQALVSAASEWVVEQPSVMPGGGTVLRFNPRCDVQAVRRRLVAAAKVAAQQFNATAPAPA